MPPTSYPGRKIAKLVIIQFSSLNEPNKPLRIANPLEHSVEMAFVITISNTDILHLHHSFFNKAPQKCQTPTPIPLATIALSILEFLLLIFLKQN